MAAASLIIALRKVNVARTIQEACSMPYCGCLSGASFADLPCCEPAHKGSGQICYGAFAVTPADDVSGGGRFPCTLPAIHEGEGDN